MLVRDYGLANLLDALAALERAGRALAGANLKGGGDRKEGQGAEDEGGNAGGDHGDESE